MSDEKTNGNGEGGNEGGALSAMWRERRAIAAETAMSFEYMIDAADERGDRQSAAALAVGKEVALMHSSICLLGASLFQILGGQ